jgi:chromate transport protein ChrA
MPRTVPFCEAYRYWLNLGFIRFGGPAEQIAITCAVAGLVLR